MQNLREEIDIIDNKILVLLKERFDIAKSIALFKKENKEIDVYDPNREKEIIKNLKSKKILDDVIIEDIWKEILYLSKCVQKEIINNVVLK
jgi:shikimate dehydrogenase